MAASSWSGIIKILSQQEFTGNRRADNGSNQLSGITPHAGHSCRGRGVRPNANYRSGRRFARACPAQLVWGAGRAYFMSAVCAGPVFCFV